MAAPRIMLVCRDPAVGKSIQDAIGREVRLTVCPDPALAPAKLAEHPFAVLMIHLAAGEGEAQVLPLLRAVTGHRRICATLALAEHFTEELVATLFRTGIADCLSLADDLPRLSWVLGDLLGWESPDAAQAAAGLALPPANPFDGFTANMEILEDQVRRVAPQGAMVLLTGETGTGKTRLARLIHELSPRREQPFLTVDCGALSPELIASDLFGHVKGSYTGADRDRPGKLAAAGAGTLFIDEVNTLPLALQSKLLRAVDDRVFHPVGSDKEQPVRARLIAASNAPLEAEVTAGRFRSDLYYRLNVVGFFLPPLRDRRECIVPLARNFLREAAQRNGRPDLIGLAPATERLLADYDWPGNVRELRNAMLRCVALGIGPRAQPEDLPEVIRSCGTRPPATVVTRATSVNLSASSSGPLTLASSKQELEIRRILEALQKHNNNRLRAAAELGISRVALYKKLKKYGLMTPRYGNSDE